MAFAGASGAVTVEGQRSYIRIETLRGKTLQKFAVLCVKFVVSRHWTAVQFPFGLLVFVKIVSP